MTAAEAAMITDRIAEVLGVDHTDIDPDGDLIAQGLDSIRMMALAGRWRRAGFDVDFARLAAAPSVRAWAELLTAPTPAEVTPGETQPVDGEPFPMAPMQHAMWVGRHADQQLGGVAGHLYVEFDGDAVDPDRLRRAATHLAARHPMLRVQFLPDGTQRVGAPPAAFPVTVLDLRDCDDVEERLTAIRSAKSRQQLDDQVFELTLTLLPGHRSRLHVDLDMQAADAMSYRALMADLAACIAVIHSPRSATRISSIANNFRRQTGSTSIDAGGPTECHSCPTRPRCRWCPPQTGPTPPGPGAGGIGWIRTPGTDCSSGRVPTA